MVPPTRLERVHPKAAEPKFAASTISAKEALVGYLPFDGFVAGEAPFCAGSAAVSFGFSFFGFLASFGPLPMAFLLEK